MNLIHRKKDCWKYGVWSGYENSILVCSKCGEMIGLRYPEIYDEEKYNFTVMNPECKGREEEIKKLYMEDKDNTYLTKE